jgi:uncharacterized membrane protein YcgQ (UPF0703/DUF1980 family)
MVTIAPFSDLQQAAPIRQASPIAQQRGDEQRFAEKSRIIDGTRASVLTSDQEIERAVQSYQRDRSEQNKFLKDGEQKTQSDQYIEKISSPTYSASGDPLHNLTAGAGGRGQYFDILT